MKTNFNQVIGIIPAAGKATRLPAIECSKEVYPIGYLNSNKNHIKMDKPVCFYLLEKLSHAGIKQALMIIREDKWDIPQILGSGAKVNIEIAYQMLRLPHGTAYTLDQAYPFVKNKLVAIGFPDILFSADDAYGQILNKLNKTHADVVLGLFPADLPHKVDMVEFDCNNLVMDIIIKPTMSTLSHTWGLAAWKPSFSDYLHNYLLTHPHNEADPELHIGAVIKQAIHDGLIISAEHISDDKPFLDIGTPDDLARAINQFKEPL